MIKEGFWLRPSTGSGLTRMTIKKRTSSWLVQDPSFLPVLTDNTSCYTPVMINKNELLRWNGNSADIKYEREEIDQVRWYELSDLYKTLINEKNSNWSTIGYEEKLLEYIKQLE